ncbi:MAG: DUF3147 family protein [Candidatus Thermoplasmatota archaeon]
MIFFYPLYSMLSSLLQTILPFFLSAGIVILITILAERHGTKIGGILGTLPSTIIIAFACIAYHQGISVAVESVVVVPAGMGINLLFLVCFSMYAYTSLWYAVPISFTVWSVGALCVYLLKITTIWISLVLFLIIYLITFFFFEYQRKTRSITQVTVLYTPLKILFRGVIAGGVIASSIILATTNPVLGGIFSIFPAIFFSTMLIAVREHGPTFAEGIAKSMIFGSPSVVSYALAIYFFYPLEDIIFGSIIAFFVSLAVTLLLYKLRKYLK